jgi:hypothetical protein
MSPWQDSGDQLTDEGCTCTLKAEVAADEGGQSGREIAVCDFRVQRWPSDLSCRVVPVDGDGLSAAGCHHLREGELSHHSQGVNATHFIVE